jgi:hypothetical protein
MGDSNKLNPKLAKRITRATSSAAEVAQNALTITVPCESKHTTQQSHVGVGAQEQLEEQTAAWESEGGHLIPPLIKEAR